MNKLTMKNAILGKCKDCSGHYLDGRADCQVTDCPLYNWMPYAKFNPVLEWLKYRLRGVGFQIYEKKTRPVSEKAMNALKEYRKNRKEQKDND